MGILGSAGGSFVGSKIGKKLGGSGKVGSVIGGIAGGFLPYELGGAVPRDTKAILHKGEFVLPAGVKPTKAQMKKVNDGKKAVKKAVKKPVKKVVKKVNDVKNRVRRRRKN